MSWWLRCSMNVKWCEVDFSMLACMRGVQEIEKVLKMLDVSSDREKETRANTYNLKMEIAALTKLVEEGAKKQGDENRSGCCLSYIQWCIK